MPDTRHPCYESKQEVVKHTETYNAEKVAFGATGIKFCLCKYRLYKWAFLTKNLCRMFFVVV